MPLPRRLLLITALAATASLAAACSGSSNSSTAGGSGSSGGTVDIAVLEPFSGPFASYGPLLEASMKAEAARINAAGGLLGKKVKVITRDDGLDPTKTVTAARELATDPNVALIEGPSFTALFNASKAVFEQNKKVNCQVAVNGDTALDGLKYAFRAGPAISKKVGAVLAYASKNTGIKTLGLVVAKDDSGTSLDAALKALAPQYGIQYLGAHFFNPGAQSQVPQVSALKNADAIFVSATSNDAAVTATQARAAGFKGKFLGVDGLLANFAYVQVPPQDVSGTILSYEGGDYLTRLPQSQWPAKYRQTIDDIAKTQGYLSDPKSGMKLLKGSSLAVDCAVEWAQAVKNAKSFDGTKVAQAWEQLKMSADQIPTGVPVQFTPQSHEEFRSASQIGVYELTKDAKGWYFKELAKPSL